jgi:16S rRNA (uracil1498-N3)-methyltransferase
MPRFFIDPQQIEGENLRLTGGDAHHAIKVLRLTPGAAITVLDGTGTVYEAVVESIDGGEVVAGVRSQGVAHEPPVAIALYQALPKADKLELVIQKATELGMARLVPVAASRSVVQVKADKAESKLARWQKIAHEAAEQSERGRVPRVEAPVAVKDVQLAEGELGLVLSERVEGPSLPRALPEAPPRGLAIFVGPEGGWTPEELETLRSKGAVEVSLGKRILRTETAGLAALAMVMAKYEL